ncbi:MAG: bifunctional diaminohydroxyphosphoribosylaminopyrimidine deaminase/5-amino-6-(5-phosphoribosylamino)uracil reductase RibD [Lachnospiraceae bacterium]|nr:bifunctional diaminohydroxyphosphoribosylaminopyrimidine deaminase/5-amino-6-(5-phosphoribosylamino)uracil reductase RibD [Lachnospiraceae bacterium]
MMEEYMRRAISLARRGIGLVSPNPLVGAVIVKNGEIIGEGWHKKYGDLHAERDALKNASTSADDAIMFVTLEPCCHQGKQPPCTEAIIESKISEVYIGSRDPNPLVSGKGVAILRENGIIVHEDFLKDECDELNTVFFHYIKEKIPYVVMKYAMTMDGRIATKSSKSKWVTGAIAREHVHKQRGKYSSIMVGSSTVIKDNPELSCRVDGGRNPIRIVVDSKLVTPFESKIVTMAKDIRTIIATTSNDEDKINKYKENAVEILKIAENDGHVDLAKMIKELGALGIDSIYVEGGGGLHAAMLKYGLYDRAEIYIAPKIFGGINAKMPVLGEGVDDPSEAFKLKNMSVTRLGEDFLFEGDFKAGGKLCLPD